MNAIGFIFCILAILSFGAIVSLEKQVSAYRFRASYLGHLAANHQILEQTTSEFYASLKQAAAREAGEKREKKEEEVQQIHSLVPPPINPDCARLNLFPLIDKDPTEEPYLYEIAAKLLRIFYGKALFEGKMRAEYRFLDAFLKAVRLQIKAKTDTALEKVSFPDPEMQMLYYKMLKGTKKVHLLEGIGYPSLLDSIKIEPTYSKICLFHAHPNLLSIFFTAQGACKLYETMHAPKAPPLTREGIERICHEVHAPLLDPECFDLFTFDQRNHVPSSKMTLIGEDPDSQISLRKTVNVHR